VRKEHLVEVGKRVRLKQNLSLLPRLLGALDAYDFAFYVISAAPQEVIQSALEGIVPPDHIHGTRFKYDPASGEIRSIERSRRATARWPCSRSSGRSCRSATTG